jgi:hypothetical protein
LHYDVVEKLQQARAALDDMATATDYFRFKRAFSECLAAVKSIDYKLDGQTRTALRKSGRRRDVPEFQDWWKQKRADVEADPLLKWAGQVRDSDTHVGDGQALGSSYAIDMLQTDDLEPGPPGAPLGIGSTGPFWIVDEGTVRERRIPARPRPGTRTALAANVVQVSVNNAPTMHLGKAIVARDPVTLVGLAVDYWESVAEEAFSLWWGAKP